MKILLVTTSFEEENREKKIQLNSHYPLGVAYLHSYLEEEGWNNVKTLFLNDYTYSDCFNIFVEEVNKFQPDLIGFNILTANRISSYVLIKFVEENYPGIKLVAGGIHVSVLWRQILEKISNKVICVVGEGEITLKEIVDGKKLEDINGIAYVCNNEIKLNKERELIKNLDDLPFPKHSMYFNNYRNTGCLLTSRGCPFRCSFCVLDSISRRRVRYRSPKNVVDEIEFMVKYFKGMQTIWIHDDNFLLNNRRAIDICKGIIDRGIKQRFICSARFKPFNAELRDWLERAGFIQILFGLETGAEKIMRLNNKKIYKQDVIDTITLLKNSPIVTTMFLIMGLYGETWETVRETTDFVKEVQKIKEIYYEDIGIAAVYPGTDLYKILENSGILNSSRWLSIEPTPIFTLEHPVNELIEMKQSILKEIAGKRGARI